MKKTDLSFLLIFMLLCSACASKGLGDVVPGAKQITPYTLQGRSNFMTLAPSRNEDGSINVLVEIPAGDHAKWEVREDGLMHHDFKNGKPRYIRYLPYPVNYGMIPQTRLSKAMGGDGDPLDVLLLGPRVPRGSLIRAKLVGVLKAIDRGERDDKLIALALNSPFDGIENLEELETKFPGVLTILKTWFENYKGPGKMNIEGIESSVEALDILTKASMDRKNTR